MTRLEQEIKEWFDEFHYSTLKSKGLAGVMMSFYLGLPLHAVTSDADEVAESLMLDREDFEIWEDIWYKKDSWFNQV